ncbi:hypothetical protein ACFLWB_00870 [Chloroflexota bacterium]
MDPLTAQRFAQIALHTRIQDAAAIFRNPNNVVLRSVNSVTRNSCLHDLNIPYRHLHIHPRAKPVELCTSGSLNNGQLGGDFGQLARAIPCDPDGVAQHRTGILVPGGIVYIHVDAKDYLLPDSLPPLLLLLQRELEHMLANGRQFIFHQTYLLFALLGTLFPIAESPGFFFG